MPYTDSSGVSIAYDDMGEGSPALLFLDGWCVNRTVFDDLAQRCAKRRRCLTLDWRGHGESEQPVLDFGAAELVEDALAVVRAGSAECVVPVALAHSGWVAVELRRNLGDRVPKIVFLEWLITGAPKPFVEALSGMQSENQWRATVDGIFKQWLHGTSNEKLIRFVKIEMGAYGFDMWSRAAREIAAAYAIWGRPLDALSQLDPPIPVLHLHGHSIPPSFREAQQEFARTHTWFRAYELDAQSHFPMFEVPEDMVRLLEEFVVERSAQVGPDRR